MCYNIYYKFGDDMTNKQTRFQVADPLEAEKVAKQVLEALEKNPGMTLKEAIGVSSETLEEIYCLAYGYYNQGRYKEAVSLFHFLAASSPVEYKYIFGLAATYLELGLLADAHIGFLLALKIDPTHPMPAYYAADCLLKMDKQSDALELLESLEEYCDTKPEFSELKERCSLLIHTIKTKS